MEQLRSLRKGTEEPHFGHNSDANKHTETL
jgi:hypothetical protein